MNLYLHGIEPHIGSATPSMNRHRTSGSTCILTNPPFGTKGANQAPERDDFTISTPNKQLNFLQHILTILRPGDARPLFSLTTCCSPTKLARS
jgi:type I restriction enzyme M protein